MEFRILGSLEAQEGQDFVDLGPRKQRSLLALLLIHANRVVPTERLLDELWGDEAEGKENALWVYVSRLRSVLPSEVIVTRDHGYVLETPNDSIDAKRFERAFQEGRALLDTDPAAASLILHEALDLWRGPALQEFAYDEFAQAESRRLDELRVACTEAAFEADLRAGRAGELIGLLEQFADEQPLREGPVRQLMLAQYRAGRQADALRTFQRFRRRLDEELGIEPSPELHRLEEQILLHDSRIRPREQAETVSAIPNPFRGLQPFREEDASLFFGRDSLVAEVVRRASSSTIVTLVGPSGSGKSSVVRAGVIPAVRKGAVDESDRWLVASMVPGSQPFAELEAALLRSTIDAPDSLTDQLSGDAGGVLRAALRILPDEHHRILLVVDQLEELFTLAAEDMRNRFLDGLVAAANDPHERVVVLATLRADFYDRPLEHSGFGAAMAGGIVNVVPMSAADLEAAAEGPARRAGARIEPALLATVISDVVGRAGALPLFQYTLTELFDRRIGDTLTAEAYAAIGGVRGSLTRRAEELYVDLDDEARRAAKQLFLRLVTISETEERTRRRVSAREILDLDLEVLSLQAVIDRFGKHRLLTFDRDQVTGAPTVEVAHEALLESWDRLAGWIADSREDVRAHTRLAAFTSEWTDHDHDPGYVLAGARLTEFETWAEETDMALSGSERAYLEASLALRAVEEEREADRAKREQKLASRARRRAWGLVAVIVAVVLGGAAILWAATRPEGPKVAVITTSAPDFASGGIESMLASGAAAAEREQPARVDVVPILADPRGEITSLIEDGTELIISDGYAFDDVLDELAADHPEVHFAVLEPFGASGLANVTAVTFDDSAGAYVVGVAAALKSRTGRIGTVGASQTSAIIEQWEAAFEAGARSVRPDIDVVASFTGPLRDLGPRPSGPRPSWLWDASFSPSSRGRAREAAQHLYSIGADVILQVGGLAGRGVLEAAAEYSRSTGTHVWAIGADVDEFLQVDASIQPYVLTSMLKRFDTAVSVVVERYLDGSLMQEELVLTLGMGGVGYAESGGHVADITDQLDAAAASVVAGEVEIPWSTVTPATWSASADRTMHVETDGQACWIEGAAPQLETGDLVSVIFSNRSDVVFEAYFVTLTEAVDPSTFAAATLEEANEIAFTEGTFHGSWAIPPGSEYELRGYLRDAWALVACFPWADVPGSFTDLIPVAPAG